MPRSPYAADRARLIDGLCARLEAGDTLQQLARRPGAPGWHTLMRWQRADPALKARFARAREYGRGVRFQARHADRFAFPSAAALALVERVRAGERLCDLVDAGRPDRAALNAWKRLNPAFAADLAQAVQASRALRRRLRGDGPAYDEATGDAIAIRIRRGETLRQVCRDPAMPPYAAVRRWRRSHPQFDAALKAHKAYAVRVQSAARAGPSPRLAARIARFITAGDSFERLCARPGMPGLDTLRRWRRERPDFAALVEQACAFRDEFLADEAFHLRTVENTPAAWRQAARLDHRRAAMGGRKGGA